MEAMPICEEGKKESLSSQSPSKENDGHDFQFCEECESNPAEYICIECEQNLCRTCDQQIHNKGARKKHKRTLLQSQDVTKQVIVQVLSEHPSGLSLAQLPLHLKYKLPFALDLNEMGFVKLKELLATMPDKIKIELRGHNHPFAKLIHHSASGSLKDKMKSIDSSERSAKFHTPRLSEDSETKSIKFVPKIPQVPIQTPKPFIDFNKQLESIRNCVYLLLQEFPSGIDSTKLPLLLYMRMGIPFDWFVFGCSSLMDFLLKYISPYYELEFIPINPYDNDHFVFLLKEIYLMYSSNYPYYAQYGSTNYSIHYRFETDPSSLSTMLPTQSVSHPSPPVKSSQPFVPQRFKSVAVEKSAVPPPTPEPTVPSIAPNPIPIHGISRALYAKEPGKSSFNSVQGSYFEKHADAEKKSRSRSGSPDHNRSVSIWNLTTEHFPPPNDSEIDRAEDNGAENEPYPTKNIKYIEQMLNDADNREAIFCSEEANSLHLKARSEDMGKGVAVIKKIPKPVHGPNLSLAENLYSIEENPSKTQKSIWISSPSSYPIFYEPYPKSPEKMEVVSEHLDKNLHIEDDSNY